MLGARNGAIPADLKLSGIRAIWTLPLTVAGPAGALVLVSRDEDPFPDSLGASFQSITDAFGGWVKARPSVRPEG